VDAGSGLRNLGKALVQDPTVSEIRFFFTHGHMDHLLGFPFFEPAYFSRYSIILCEGPHAQHTARKYLGRQMEEPYFPVSFERLKARFVFRCEQARPEASGCYVCGIECCPVPLSHPNGGYGFKFKDEGKKFVFLTDNELGFRHPNGRSRAEYVEFCRGAHLLLHDAQYTEAEYEETRGWGHSTYADATDLALDAGVERLGLFHHDPDRTDEDLDRQVEFCRERIRERGSALECFAAVEGMVLEI
jgi:ribonuclease BN (tRNA processing enzyme)